MKQLAVLTRYSKFIAAAIGAATEAINVGVLPAAAHNDVAILVTVLTALGVVGVSNTEQKVPHWTAPEPALAPYTVPREVYRSLTVPKPEALQNGGDLHAGVANTAPWPA